MNTKHATLTKVNAEKADVRRLDKLAKRLETSRGGSWFQRQAFKAAVDALERELSHQTTHPDPQ